MERKAPTPTESEWCIVPALVGGTRLPAICAGRSVRSAGFWLALSALLAARTPAAVLHPGLRQPAGNPGCISETGAETCVNGHHLEDPFDVAVSPDGRHVYAAISGSDALVIFDRDPNTGGLAQKLLGQGCVSETGDIGLCADGRSLLGANGVVVSPDGRNVYVSSFASGGVAVFDRSSDGSVVQKAGTDGCIRANGATGCATGIAFNGPAHLAISADGRNVYVTMFTDDAVAVLDRDLATGVLTQKAGTAGCISLTGNTGACVVGTALDAPTELTVSPDGANVYVASPSIDAIAIFDRDQTTGALTQKAGTAGCVSDTGTGGSCVDGIALDGVNSVEVSADGKNAYVTASGANAVSIFDRNFATGALTQKAGTAGCVSETGTGGACADGNVVSGAQGLALGPDGTTLYVTAGIPSAIAIFDRQPSTGVLTQKPGTDGCITNNTLICVDARALSVPKSPTVSLDGRNVYVVTGLSNSIAVFDRTLAPYDIDGNGLVEPLTDGLLLLRESFGFTGSTLVNGAVDLVKCTRCTATEIEAFIASLSG